MAHITISLACSRRAESKDQPKSACIHVVLLLRVSAEAESCSTMLNCLYSVDIGLCDWIPHRATISKFFSVFNKDDNSTFPDLLGGGVAEWGVGLDWRPDGFWPGSNPTAQTFRFGTLAIPFTPLCLCQCLSETLKAVCPFY